MHLVECYTALEVLELHESFPDEEALVLLSGIAKEFQEIFAITILLDFEAEMIWIDLSQRVEKEFMMFMDFAHLPSRFFLKRLVARCQFVSELITR